LRNIDLNEISNFVLEADTLVLCHQFEQYDGDSGSRAAFVILAPCLAALNQASMELRCHESISQGQTCVGGHRGRTDSAAHAAIGLLLTLAFDDIYRGQAKWCRLRNKNMDHSILRVKFIILTRPQKIVILDSLFSLSCSKMPLL
jgi:hypothetical protein